MYLLLFLDLSGLIIMKGWNRSRIHRGLNITPLKFESWVSRGVERSPINYHQLWWITKFSTVNQSHDPASECLEFASLWHANVFVFVFRHSGSISYKISLFLQSFSVSDLDRFRLREPASDLDVENYSPTDNGNQLFPCRLSRIFLRLGDNYVSLSLSLSLSPSWSHLTDMGRVERKCWEWNEYVMYG